MWIQVAPEFAQNVTFLALKWCSKRGIDNDDKELKIMEMQKCMEIIGLRNGSRTRRAAPPFPETIIKALRLRSLFDGPDRYFPDGLKRYPFAWTCLF